MCAEIEQSAEEPHTFSRPGIWGAGYAVEDSETPKLCATFTESVIQQQGVNCWNS